MLREIVTTERAYVADLTAITQFLPALRSAALPAAELDALVGNVDSLLLVHGELLGRLEAAGDSVVGFAHAFCSITPFLRMYSIYCARYGAVVGAVNAAAVNAAALAALEEARGERLDSLLVKPVQRICKYPSSSASCSRRCPPTAPSARSCRRWPSRCGRWARRSTAG